MIACSLSIRSYANKSQGGFWIHPSKPSSLIEEQVASCSSLLASYHSVIGSTPLTMNWESQKSKDLLDNDEIAITSMKVLQSYVLALSKFPQTLMISDAKFLTSAQGIISLLAAKPLKCIGMENRRVRS